VEAPSSLTSGERVPQSMQVKRAPIIAHHSIDRLER
jgi:hypothetical protein